jgi:hypothetical protein
MRPRENKKDDKSMFARAGSVTENKREKKKTEKQEHLFSNLPDRPPSRYRKTMKFSRFVLVICFIDVGGGELVSLVHPLALRSPNRPSNETKTHNNENENTGG